jgi:predicted DNA-binding transcriptional regulator YafY
LGILLVAGRWPLAAPPRLGDDARIRRAARCFSSSVPCAAAAPRCRRRSLAQTLRVSLRTVCRDLADLQLSGVPIEGEAGVGDVLRNGPDIPPLMFTANEIEAWVIGSRFVRAFGRIRLAESAPSA